MFKRTAKALGRLDDRQQAAAEDVIKLQRDIRALKLEWEETYDKIHRLFGRIAKRQAIDHPAPLITPEVPEPPDDGLDEISRAIHARRSKGKAA